MQINPSRERLQLRERDVNPNVEIVREEQGQMLVFSMVPPHFLFFFFFVFFFHLNHLL